jgi:hypothetical protein
MEANVPQAERERAYAAKEADLQARQEIYEDMWYWPVKRDS